MPVQLYYAINDYFNLNYSEEKFCIIPVVFQFSPVALFNADSLTFSSVFLSHYKSKVSLI